LPWIYSKNYGRRNGVEAATNTPFVKEFDYGTTSSNEGYWSYGQLFLEID
jgi:hypothetical protein